MVTPPSGRNPRFLHLTRDLLGFFSLTYEATRLLWAAAQAISLESPPDSQMAAMASGVFLLGVFAPGLLASLSLTGPRGERQPGDCWSAS